jgi:hypothetical protein
MRAGGTYYKLTVSWLLWVNIEADDKFVLPDDWKKISSWDTVELLPEVKASAIKKWQKIIKGE